MLNDAGVPAPLVDVKTQNGVVTLSGWADNLLAKERSARIAATVKGVRAVVNRIVVTGGLRSDAAILNDVRTALQKEPATDAYKIDLMVSHGVVTLLGAVDSWQEKQLAAQVAKGVKGVEEVKNEITVKAATERPDRQIAAEIARRLAADIWVDEGSIKVTVNGGEVTLSGTVGSAAEKSRAALDAWVAGVKAVHDGDLQVNDIVVAVVNGKVYLSGVVDSQVEKAHTEDVVSHINGVIAVQDNLTVPTTPPVKSDWQITQDIRDELWWNPYVDSDAVTVSVQDGIATLSGTVNSWAERLDAIENAYEGGAQSVRDELKVTNGPAEYWP